MSKKFFFFYGGERDEMPEIEPIPINREIIEQEGARRRKIEEMMSMQNVRYEVRPDKVLVPILSDGNTVTRASERGIEPVQPRDLWVDPLRSTPMDDRELRRVWDADARRRAISWCGAMAFGSIINDLERCVFVDGEGHHFAIPGDPRSRVKDQSRESRFDTLRAEGKKLGEINAILEAEGYSEVFGEGVMPAPTKSHQIVRENKGAKKLIETLP